MTEQFASEIKKFTELVTDFKSGIHNKVRDFLTEKAETVVDKTRENIISKGQSTHKSLSGYSTKGKQGTRWMDKRKRAGLQTGYKDLFFTGSLTMNFTTTDQKVEGDIVSVETGINKGVKGARGKDLEMIAVKLSEQEGLSSEKNLFDLSADDIKKVEEEADKFIYDELEALLNKIKI